MFVYLTVIGYRVGISWRLVFGNRPVWKQTLIKALELCPWHSCTFYHKIFCYLCILQKSTFFISKPFPVCYLSIIFFLLFFLQWCSFYNSKDSSPSPKKLSWSSHQYRSFGQKLEVLLWGKPYFTFTYSVGNLSTSWHYFVINQIEIGLFRFQALFLLPFEYHF